MNEVRRIRSLDGEALRNEHFVEQRAALKHVRENAVESIATLEIVLDMDGPPLQSLLREQRGFLTETLCRLVRMLDLGSVHPDQPEAFGSFAEDHVDAVSVHDSGDQTYDRLRPLGGSGRLSLTTALGEQRDCGEGGDQGSLHGGQRMAP
jgi:hypothetical protein